MPRFSVIVPVYGQGRLLSQCLEHVRASNFDDYEIIVSDDGSPDEAEIRSVAARYQARLIRSESRTGSAAARNRAAQVALGHQLVFIDADVTPRPETLSLLAE